MISEHAGLLPYKLKMMMFPQLVESGCIQRPFDHLCESLEKLNQFKAVKYSVTTKEETVRVTVRGTMF